MEEDEDKKPEENKEEVVARLEKATKEMNEATQRNKESLALIAEEKAKSMLSGQAEAGQETQKKSPEERMKENIKAWMPADFLPETLK